MIFLNKYYCYTMILRMIKQRGEENGKGFKYKDICRWS